MRIGELKKPANSKKKRKRVGRGPGSGHGKTSTRGHKGQKARAGAKKRAWFEGGQMPLQRRVPKRGFTNIFRGEYQIVNLKSLEKLKDQSLINPEILLSFGVIKKRTLPVKILGEGELKVPLTVQAHAFSKTAQAKIKACGGKVEIIK
jgi:large subunit ribosomal protein L15